MVSGTLYLRMPERATEAVFYHTRRAKHEKSSYDFRGSQRTSWCMVD